LSWFWGARGLTGDVDRDAPVKRTLRTRLTVSWLLLGAALLTSVFSVEELIPPQTTP
jgi:hypothetical protein